jgi:hypothetical protein
MQQQLSQFWQRRLGLEESDLREGQGSILTKNYSIKIENKIKNV